MGPLALAHADLVPGLVEDDRPAAPRAEVDRHDVFHGRVSSAATASSRAHSARSRAARLATFTSGSPAANRSISAAAMRPPLAIVSYVAPPMCVAMTTFGASRSRCRVP